MSGKDIALLAPLIIIYLALMLAALFDLEKREHVRGGRKWVWALVIVLINILGPVAYFLFGREDR